MKLRKFEKVLLCAAALSLLLALGVRLIVGAVPVSVQFTAASALPTAAPMDDGGKPGKIDINAAAAETLCFLPGIGEALAGRIIAYRAEHNGFDTAEEIMEVSGIGEAKFQAIQDLITVGEYHENSGG